MLTRSTRITGVGIAGVGITDVVIAVIQISVTNRQTDKKTQRLADEIRASPNLAR